MKNLKLSTPNQRINDRIVKGDIILRVLFSNEAAPKIVEEHEIKRVRPVNALTDGEAYFYYDKDGSLIFGGGDYTMKGKRKFGYENYVKRTLQKVNPSLYDTLYPPFKITANTGQLPEGTKIEAHYLEPKVCKCTDCKNCPNAKKEA